MNGGASSWHTLCKVTVNTGSTAVFNFLSLEPWRALIHTCIFWALPTCTAPAVQDF